jgi:DNA-binding transcriptional ArsR family regulator
MVVCKSTDAVIDDLFHALADTTRRDILRRAVDGEQSVSRLAAAYPMSFAAVQKLSATVRVGPTTTA